MSIIGGCNLAICHRSAILHLLSFLLSGIQYAVYIKHCTQFPHFENLLQLSLSNPFKLPIHLVPISRVIRLWCVISLWCCSRYGEMWCVRPGYDHISVSVLVQVPGPTITTTSHFHPVLSPAAASSPQTSHHTSQHGDVYLWFIWNNCCLNKGRSEQGRDCTQEEQFKL